MTDRYIIEDKRKDKIIRDYLKDVSIEKLRSKYKIGHVLIRRYLGDLYDPKRGKRLSKERNPRKVDFNPFKNLKDPKVQYWLGMIASDGNIRDDNTICISLGEKDNDHLKKYCKFLKLKESPRLNYDKTHNCYASIVNFTNLEVADFLKSIGITPRKSFTIKMNFNFDWNFVRGVIDGDGYIGFFQSKKRRKNHCTIDIATASKGFAYQLKEFIEKYNIPVSIYKYNYRSVYTIRVRNFVNCKKYLSFLYQDADTYLERKYQRAQLIRNYETQTDSKLRELASKNPEASL